MTVSTMIEKAKIRTLAPKSIALYHLESNQCCPAHICGDQLMGRDQLLQKRLPKILVLRWKKMGNWIIESNRTCGDAFHFV